jgi:hypothetical protein
LKSLQKTAIAGIFLALSLMGCAQAGGVGIFVSNDEDIQEKALTGAQSLFPVPVHRTPLNPPSLPKPRLIFWFL